MSRLERFTLATTGAGWVLIIALVVTQYASGAGLKGWTLVTLGICLLSSILSTANILTRHRRERGRD